MSKEDIYTAIEEANQILNNEIHRNVPYDIYSRAFEAIAAIHCAVDKHFENEQWTDEPPTEEGQYWFAGEIIDRWSGYVLNNTEKVSIVQIPCKEDLQYVGKWQKDEAPEPPK